MGLAPPEVGAARPATPAVRSARRARPLRPSPPTPFLWPAIGLMAGIVLADLCGPLGAGVRIPVRLAPFVLMAAAVWGTRRTADPVASITRGPILTTLVLAMLGAAVGFERQQVAIEHPGDHIVHALADEPVLTRLAGQVVGTPVERPGEKRNPFLPFEPGPRTSFVMAVEELRTTVPPTRACGLVRVGVEAAELGLRPGTRVELTGRLYRPAGPRNPGEIDWRAWNRRQGIEAGLAVDGVAYVRRLGDEPSPVQRASEWLRAWARGMLLEVGTSAAGREGEADEATDGGRDLAADPSYLRAGTAVATRSEPGAQRRASADGRARAVGHRGSPLPGELLEVMILGQRSAADRQLNEAFLRAGGMHFLAVSGFNVAVLAWAAWLVMRRLLRRGARAAAVVTLLLTLLFALVTEPNAPILRATICVVLACAAQLLGRPMCALNWLALSAGVIVLLDPQELFSGGFQLSFVQVLALILVVPPVYGWATRRRPADITDDADAPREAQTVWELIRRRLASWGVGLVVVCACAYIVAQPLVLLHFGRFAPWGLPGTLLLTPLVTLITVVSVAKVLLSFVPVLGTGLGWVLGVMTELLLWSVGLFDNMPAGVVETARPSVWLVAGSYGAVLAGVLIQRRIAGGSADYLGHGGPTPRWPFRHWQVTGAGALVVAWLGWALWAHGPARPIGWRSGDVAILDVLAVGDGAAAVLVTKDGHAAVIDVGTNTNSDAGETVVRALRTTGVQRIDVVMVSHANFDHYSGLPSLLAKMPTDQWLVGPSLAPGAAGGEALPRLQRLLPAGAPARVRLRAGDRLDAGEARIEVLWPPAELGGSWAVNDQSLVVRVEAGGGTVLLAGDIEEDAQAALVAMDRAGRVRLRADVLVAPHHGSVAGRVTEDFYAAVGPEAVIASTRTPRPKLLSMVEDVLGPACPVWTTGEFGAVRVRLRDGDAGVEVSPATAP